MRVGSSGWELRLEFFCVFSRFEYALKRTRFCTPGWSIHRGRPDARRSASADWKAFGRQIDNALMSCESQEFVRAADYLFSAPPSRQIVAHDGGLGWDPIGISGKRTAGKLLELVKAVRNNLFHGGKCSPDDVGDCVRNEWLINCSLAVLWQSLQCDDEVRGEFNRGFTLPESFAHDISRPWGDNASSSDEEAWDTSL